MSIEISLSSLESSSARRQKAESRYRTALESLHKVLLKEKFTNSELFPTINDTNAVTIASRASELEAAINHISKSTKSAQNVQSRTRIVVEMFQGLYPFMQLLHKAADAAMHLFAEPYGLISAALLILIQIAYDEVGRAIAIDETLNVLSNAVHRIQLTNDFPAQLNSSTLDNVQCAALDLCSAVMEYLALAIRILRKKVIVNIASNILKGNKEFEDAMMKVNNCVNAYTEAVIDLCCALGIHHIIQSESIKRSVDSISEKLDSLTTEFETHSRIVECALQTRAVTPNPQPEKAFLVPYAKNPLFTGRESYFKLIQTKLLDDSPRKHRHCLALHGLGGIGKTQIAIEYTHRHRSNFEFVFWLHAAERTTLISDLTSIAKETKCVAFHPDIPLEDVAMQVLRWLNGRSNWLLVFDNLDDVSVVFGLLPDTSNGGHILITTRCKDVKQIPAEGLEIVEMSEDEAIDLLLDSSDNEMRGQKQLEAAKEIVKELGCLPLAIGQAAAFIRSSDLYSFIDVFHSCTQAFLADMPEGNHPYSRSISTTWSMCLSKLTPESSELIEILSFLNPDEILVEFLELGSSALSENLQSIVQNKYRFVKAIKRLQDFSLVKIGASGRTISIHRLVQLVIRDGLPQEHRLQRQKEILRMSEMLFQSFSLDSLDFGTREKYRKFLPQITAALEIYDEEVYNQFAISPFADSFASFLYEEGQGIACMQLDSKIMDIRTRILGTDDPRTLRIKRGLAASLVFEHGCTSIPLFEDVLAAQRRVLGPSHPDTLWTQHSLGVAYQDVGMLGKASQLLQTAFKLRSEVLGPDHLHTLRSKLRLAFTHMETKEVTRGLEEVLSDTTRVLGETHSDTIRVMGYLARQYAYGGLFDRASEISEKIYLLWKAGLGEHHPRTIRSKDEWMKLQIFIAYSVNDTEIIDLIADKS